MLHTQEEWIRQLNLQPHPEGGWYREIYRSDESVPAGALPARFQGPRSFSTAIYYLLGPGDFSAIHCIRSDEIWHFYDGSPLSVHLIDPATKKHRVLKLGRDLSAGQHPVAIVPAGCWFGAIVNDPEGFALVGCTVSPGFDFEDFQLPTRGELLENFPEHRSVIERLTR